MDVRVAESGDDAAPAEIDALGGRESGLVRADTADDRLSGYREPAGRRERRIQCAHDAVLEDHGAKAMCSRALDDAEREQQPDDERREGEQHERKPHHSVSIGC
jgi:hypothetical protein